MSCVHICKGIKNGVANAAGLTVTCACSKIACQEAKEISFPYIFWLAWANLGWMINELCKSRSCVHNPQPYHSCQCHRIAVIQRRGGQKTRFSPCAKGSCMWITFKNSSFTKDLQSFNSDNYCNWIIQHSYYQETLTYICRNIGLQSAQAHQNTAIEDWKNVAWSDECPIFNDEVSLWYKNMKAWLHPAPYQWFRPVV